MPALYQCVILQKFLNVTILTVGTLSFIGFVAEVEEWIPRNMAAVWVFYVFGTMCITGNVLLWHYGRISA